MITTRPYHFFIQVALIEILYIYMHVLVFKRFVGKFISKVLIASQVHVLSKYHRHIAANTLYIVRIN